MERSKEMDMERSNEMNMREESGGMLGRVRRDGSEGKRGEWSYGMLGGERRWK